MISGIVWRRGMELREAVLQIRRSKEQKVLNVSKISSLIEDMPALPSPISTDIYRTLADITPIKVQKVISRLDKILSNTTGKEAEEGNCDLARETIRLQTVLKHGLPQQQIAQKINEELLTRAMPPSEAEIAALAHILIHINNPTKELIKLANLIFECINENLPKLTPSSITRLIQVLSRSKMPLPGSLSDSLNSHLTPSLYRLPYNTMINLTYLTRPSPVSFLNRLGMLQTNPIERRLTYKYIIAGSHFGLQTDSVPGVKLKTSEDLSKALNYIKMIGSNESYIDFFPVRGQGIGRSIEGVFELTDQKHTSEYVNYIFGFIAMGWYKIPKVASFKICKVFKSFFEGGVITAGSFVKNSQGKVDLLKFLVIAEQIGRNLQKEIEVVELMDKIKSVCVQLLNKQYVSRTNVMALRFYERNMVNILLKNHLIRHFCNHLSKENKKHSVLDIEAISALINQQQEDKKQRLELETTKSYHHFVSALLKQVKLKKADTNSVVSGEELSIAQLNILLQASDQEQILSSAQIQDFIQKYTLLHTVKLQPNLQLSLILCDKSTKQILHCFDFNPHSHDKSIYQHYRNGYPDTEQSYLLAMSGATKQLFVEGYYGGLYHHCRNERERTQKLIKVIQSICEQS